MILLGGVDEAGLGPLLGPLCIGAAGLLADEVCDPWERLAPAVSKEPKGDAHGLVVGDSKRVFTRNERGHRRLETSVLAFASIARGVVDGRRRLSPEDLSLGGEDERAWLERHPWHEARPKELPLFASADLVELRTDQLRRALERGGLGVAGFGVRTVEPGELNREFDRTGNKGAATWRYVAPAIGYLLGVAVREGATSAHVAVDRQGARARYGPSLARALPSYSVELVEEGPVCSRYRLSGPVEAEVWFREKEDRESFATALASCGAKYARELAMGAFNAWFGERAPDLEPTAGYATDGRRWLGDAARRAGALLDGIDRELLVRKR
ncbi:MAG: hypothetical protein R3F34_09605 [Planctomycetota bacterium]